MILEIMGRNNVEGLKGSLKYIENENKTLREEDYINAAIGEDSLSFSLKYIENEDKIKKKYVSGYKCNVNTAEFEFKNNIEKVAALAGKGIIGNVYYHIIQSVPSELSEYISDDEVHQMGLELVDSIGEYQAVIASHLNSVIEKESKLEKGKFKHNHIIMNAFKYYDDINEGSVIFKWNDCHKTVKMLRKLNDEISIAHGYSFILDTNQNRYVKDKIKKNVIEIYEKSKSFDDFRKKLKNTYKYTLDESDGNLVLKTSKNFKLNLQELGEEFSLEKLKNLSKDREGIFNLFRKNELKKKNVLSEILDCYSEDELFVSLTLKKRVKENEKKIKESERNDENVNEEKKKKVVKDEDRMYRIAFPLNTIHRDVMMNCYISENNKFDILVRHDDDYVYIGEVNQKEICNYFESKNREKSTETYNKLIKKINEFYDDNFKEYINRWFSINKNKYEEKYIPYHFDLNKSLLELLFELILICSFKEQYLYQNNFNKYPSKSNKIYVKRNYQIQKKLNAMCLLRKEGITTNEQMKSAKRKCGKTIGFIRSEIQEYQNILNNMKEIYDAIESYKMCKSSHLNGSNMCKAYKEFLNKNGILSAEDRKEYVAFYLEIISRRNNSEANLFKIKKKYRELSYASNMLNRWQNQFADCFVDYEENNRFENQKGLDEAINNVRRINKSTNLNDKEYEYANEFNLEI